MCGHVPKSPVQPGSGSYLKAEVVEREREVERRDNGKWRRKTTKTMGGDVVQSLWVIAVWVNTLSESH